MAALLLDPVFSGHLTGEGHPERPARYDAVTIALSASGLISKMTRLPMRRATVDEAALVHDRAYLETARRDVARLAGSSAIADLSTGDTSICAKSWDIALDAVGGVLNAVDAVMQKKSKTAFCAVRPPGHHATPTRGMGFCLLNNIAIAARYAQRKHGVERVLIADWDVHHGNGTQDAFYSDGSVFFFSTHQAPWYPGTGDAAETGDGKGSGRIMNCPLPAGSGMSEIAGAFRDRLVPAMERFRPDLVMVSAGFDSRAGDPLGRFTLTDRDFADLTKILRDVAEKYAGGRLISSLEGGYSLNGLASGVNAHAHALLG